jgi:hypothetical protein
VDASPELVICPRCDGAGDPACPVCHGCTCLKERRGEAMVVVVVRGECRAARHGTMLLRVAERR